MPQKNNTYIRWSVHKDDTLFCISPNKIQRHLKKCEDFCYNTPMLLGTITCYSQREFITADKILISIHRTANTIWAIKIIRIAGAISYKQNCLRYKSLQRARIISDTL